MNDVMSAVEIHEDGRGGRRGRVARLEAEAAQAAAAAEVLDDLEARVLQSNAALEARTAENAALKEEARPQSNTHPLNPKPCAQEARPAGLLSKPAPLVRHIQNTSLHTPAGRSTWGSTSAQACGLSHLFLHIMVSAALHHKTQSRPCCLATCIGCHDYVTLGWPLPTCTT